MARSTNGALKSKTITVKADDPADIAVLEKVSAAAKVARRSEADQILMDLGAMKQYQVSQPDQAE